ncbi:phosphopantothenoylcysteine decarboxylase domain-containing protein, partial [Neisseria meningitidis]
AKPLSIELDENPDILASIASLPNPPFCIGFAAETENVMAYAREKRIKKKIPVIVANDVSIAMGKPTNRITIIGDDGELSFPETSKDEAAMQIVERLAGYLNK